MELHELFKIWKLNHNHFAKLLGIHKGSFNNKLNPIQKGRFTDEEIFNLKKHLRNMKADIDTYLKTYPMVEEDLIGPVDEEITYNGKTFS